MDSFEQAIEVANGVPYGLSASIYTRDVNKAFAGHARSVYRNRLRECADDRSGNASAVWRHQADRQRPSRSGIAAIDFYTEWKTMYIDYSDRLQRAQIDQTRGLSAGAVITI